MHRFAVNSVKYRIVERVPLLGKRKFLVLGNVIMLKERFDDVSPGTLAKACGYAIQHVNEGVLVTLVSMFFQRLMKRRDAFTVDGYATDYGLSRVGLVSTLLENRKQ